MSQANPQQRIAKTTFSGILISLFQIVASRVCQLYLKFYGSYSLVSSTKIEPTSNYLFIANHQSQLDPFSVFASLSFRENLNAAPVRFLTAKTVYYTPLLFFLKSMGCYPTRGSRDKIIEESLGYLKTGYNVFMFPEGKRTLQIDSQPRPGVSDLIRKASSEIDLKIVLVHIEWQRGRFGRRHVTVSMTEASKELYNKDATDIMSALYKV